MLSVPAALSPRVTFEPIKETRKQLAVTVNVSTSYFVLSTRPTWRPYEL